MLKGFPELNMEEYCYHKERETCKSKKLSAKLAAIFLSVTSKVNSELHFHLSSSQLGFIFANFVANLLCSLIHRVCIEVRPGISFARLSPAAKQWILGLETRHSPLKVVRSRGGSKGLRTPNSVNASKPEMNY